MPLDKEELLEKIEELRTDLGNNVKDFDKLKEKVKVLENKPVQLNRYLDNTSRDIIEDVVSDRILDIVWNDYFHYLGFFESLDGWSVDVVGTGAGGAVNTATDGVNMSTGDDTGDFSDIKKQPQYQNIFTYNQESRFKTDFHIRNGDTTDFIINFSVGQGYSSTERSYGFRIDGTTLLGVTCDASSESTVILDTISSAKRYVVEARFYPGSKVDFYVTDADAETLNFKGALTTNLPSGRINPDESNTTWFWYRALTEADATKLVQFDFVEYIQRKVI